MTMVERVAKSIYDATDPLSGDPIATLIHVSDHLFWDGVQPDKEMTDIERQLEAVQEVCRAAARAALSAMMKPNPSMINRFVSRALCVSIHGDGGWSNYASEQWQAMLAAALDEGAE